MEEKKRGTPEEAVKALEKEDDVTELDEEALEGASGGIEPNNNCGNTSCCRAAE